MGSQNPRREVQKAPLGRPEPVACHSVRPGRTGRAERRRDGFGDSTIGAQQVVAAVQCDIPGLSPSLHHPQDVGRECGCEIPIPRLEPSDWDPDGLDRKPASGIPLMVASTLSDP